MFMLRDNQWREKQIAADDLAGAREQAVAWLSADIGEYVRDTLVRVSCVIFDGDMPICRVHLAMDPDMATGALADTTVSYETGEEIARFLQSREAHRGWAAWAEVAAIYARQGA